MTDLTTLPRWPRVEARTHPDGSGELTVNGTSHPVPTTDPAAARVEMTRRIADLATKLGRPIRVATTGPEGSWSIIVHRDATVEPDPDSAPRPAATQHDPRRRTTRPRRDGQPAEQPRPMTAGRGQPAAPPSASWAQETPSDDCAGNREAARAWGANSPAPGAGTDSSASAVQPPWVPQPAVGAHTEVSPAALPTVDDLLGSRPAPSPGPAERGWRGMVRRFSLGAIRPRPGPAEAAHRAAVGDVQRSLDGPKTIVVINPKGGAHKTTATLLLAATFGHQRGGYTLAWDNNETRGTLGWRAQRAQHARTATDLLDDLERFATVTQARIGDLDHYVRPQTGAHFDVLASDEDAAAAATIDADAFGRLHSTLARFYRVLVVDTGNNMRAPNWGAAVDAADQLVVVSTIREDTAATAAWLVDGLRARGHEDKVAHAVTLLAAPDSRPADAALHARLRDHFNQLTRAVLDVPYDAALAAGAPIDVDALRPRTREAWLQAAATIANGL